MRFSILQFRASRDAIDHLNSVGWDGDFGDYPELAIQRDVLFSGGSDGWSPWMMAYYRGVANVEATDLEEVFHIGNGYGDQDKIVKLDQMRSLSVGDLVECHDTGVVFMCDPMGWTAVMNVKEAA